MAYYRQAVLIFVAFNCICVDLVKSVSNVCNTDEFLQPETGSCVTCTVCDIKLGLVTWIPCTNDSDTICGPQLTLRDPTISEMKSKTKHHIMLNDNEQQLTEVNKWKTVENILTGVLIGVGLTCVIVILSVSVLRRRRRRDSQWKKLTLRPNKTQRKGDIRSIEEIAEDREIIINEHGNMYVKTGDILAITRPVQSPV